MRRTTALLVLAVALSAADLSHADPFIARNGLNAAQFELQNLAMLAQHYRPRVLDAVTTSTGVWYSGIWEPFDPSDPAQKYDFKLDMTPEQLQDRNDTLAPLGYYPVSVAGFEVGTAAHFAVIWHYDPTVTYTWRAGLSPDEYQALFDQLTHSICGKDGRGRATQDVLAGLSGRPGAEGLAVRQQQFLERAADRRPGHFPGSPRGTPTPGCYLELMDVDGYLDNGALRYIAVWQLQGGAYAARAAMSFDQFVYEAFPSGVDPEKISAYPDGAGGTAYARILHAHPHELRYVFPRLDPVDYQALFDLKVGQGYTLLDVASEPDDSGRGVLYSSLWKAPVGPDQQLALSWPLAGVPGIDWTLVNYEDHDPAAGSASDYLGGTWLYDNHNGTDITLRNFPEMDAGIDVLAAADGTVDTIVDGHFDRNTCGGPSGCNICAGSGNYILLRHANGQKTWYMHLKAGSTVVHEHEKVARGQKLAEVGSSGPSSDPHLHFAVINGPNYNWSVGADLVDPFEGPNGNSQNLWIVAPPDARTRINIMDADTTGDEPAPCDYHARPAHVGAFHGPFPGGALVTMWMQLGGRIGPSNQVSYQLVAPDGSIGLGDTIPDGDYSYYFQTASALLFRLAPIPGTWHWDISRNGTVVFSLPFDVVP